MIVALASPRVAASVGEALDHVVRLTAEAAGRGARVVCFPEAYVPGLRGLDFEVAPFGRAEQERVLATVSAQARESRISVVLGMEWHSAAGRQIAAVVIGPDGALQGIQTKNQLDPSEDSLYAPGTTRRLFEAEGVRFGVVICHEGFRYPETVRWAATRGARVVFHPHCTGGDRAGATPSYWGDPAAPYYERAMACRALENTIYLGAVNYAFRRPESATCFIAPDGTCLDRLPYGEEGVLVRDLDPAAATGMLAMRHAAGRYLEEGPPPAPEVPWPLS